jgi:hypothetical protein
MERTLYDRDGYAVAYITDDYHETVYMWDGTPVAYLYDDQHVYGINGRHLGWFIDDILYNNNGARIGFTVNTCPVPVAKQSTKTEKKARDEIRPRWAAPPMPKLSFDFSNQALPDLLRQGQVIRLPKEEPPQSPEEPAIS